MAEPFAYALIRVVPDLARGECVNVGVVVHCPTRRYLGCRFAVDGARLRALAPSADLEALRTALAAIGAVLRGEPGAGPLAALPAGERFGWVAAPASTTIQPSPVHTGLTEDPAAALTRLFDLLVAL